MTYANDSQHGAATVPLWTKLTAIATLVAALAAGTLVAGNATTHDIGAAGDGAVNALEVLPEKPRPTAVSPGKFKVEGWPLERI